LNLPDTILEEPTMAKYSIQFDDNQASIFLEASVRLADYEYRLKSVANSMDTRDGTMASLQGQIRSCAGVVTDLAKKSQIEGKTLQAIVAMYKKAEEGTHASLTGNPVLQNLTRLFQTFIGLVNMWVVQANTGSTVNPQLDSGSQQTAPNPSDSDSSGSNGNYDDYIGHRIADVENYTSGITGECVWYVRGRAKEKLGADTGIFGNGGEWWGQAVQKGLSTGQEIRTNSIACFSGPTSYGHVIFVEAVDGDTVYYTEANMEPPYSDGVISPLDGVLKSTSLNQFRALCNQSLQGFIYL
jgi:surface antigen